MKLGKMFKLYNTIINSTAVGCQLERSGCIDRGASVDMIFVSHFFLNVLEIGGRYYPVEFMRIEFGIIIIVIQCHHQPDESWHILLRRV